MKYMNGGFYKRVDGLDVMGLMYKDGLDKWVSYGISHIHLVGHRHLS